MTLALTPGIIQSYHADLHLHSTVPVALSCSPQIYFLLLIDLRQ